MCFDFIKDTGGGGGKRLTQYETLRHLEHRLRLPCFEHFAQDSGTGGMSLWIGKQSRQVRDRLRKGPLVGILI